MYLTEIVCIYCQKKTNTLINYLDIMQSPFNVRGDGTSNKHRASK